MNNRQEFQTIVLAALLHDIGKIGQRAKLPFESPKTINEESNLCPYNKEGNYYYHRHVLWTYDFLSTYLPQSGPRYLELLELGINPVKVLELASQHHKPLVPLQEIIHKADIVSSYMDREPRPEDDPAYQDSYYTERLRPIFPLVDLNLKEKPNYQENIKNLRYDLKPLTLDKEVIFPANFYKEDLSRLYKTLFSGFKDEFQRLPLISFDRFLNSLLSLLHRFTWCIPSSTIDIPDISLFDHLKTTAAIASCLYLWEICQEPKDQKPYLMLMGDISGIQKYLYKITQPAGIGGISKRLRGRSFYLAVLPEITARFILREVGLSMPNLLYAGGGNFCLLLPNISEITKTKIPILIRKINKWMREEFSGELSLVFNYLSCDNNGMKDFGRILRDVAEGLNDKKLRKFVDLIEEEKEKFFIGKAEVGPDLTICPSCNIKVIKKTEGLCSQCNAQREIGNYIAKTAKFIAYSNAPLKFTEGEEKSVGALNFGTDGEFGFVYLLPERESNDNLFNKLDSSKDVVEIASFNVVVKNYGLKFLGKTVPVALEDFVCETEEKGKANKGHILTFNTIGSTSIGDKRIGVLKMDVDRLGVIFSLGLPEEKRSISRITSLSRQLDMFFCGYINKICEACYESWKIKDIDFPDKDRISNIFYVNYSGGDDLLIIGPWSEIPHLAKKIKDEFFEYVCKNPEITISAGVFMPKPDFPISRAAVLATEELEEKAKKVRNQIALFNQAVSWNNVSDNRTDLNDLLEIGEFLYEKLKDKKIPRSYVHGLLRWHKQFLTDDKLNPMYIPVFIYQTYRNIKDENLAKEFREMFLANKKGIERFKKVVIPATYALYKTRR